MSGHRMTTPLTMEPSMLPRDHYNVCAFDHKDCYECELVEYVDALAARLSAAESALASAREANQRAASFAKHQAIGAHALGYTDRERQWLDLVHLLDGAE